MLAGVSSYTTWRRAQAGIAQIEADVAGVVVLEKVRAGQFAPGRQVGEQVEAGESARPCGHGASRDQLYAAQWRGD